jgi:tripartite-type tricarboxylate transporter receptor subunit TctC
VASPAAKPSGSGAGATTYTYNEQAVADFYRGKTIRLIVGYAPGGGYDTYARIIAPLLSKYIPGNPTVVVENMAGAGSQVAFSQTYNSLPKDGTVITSGDGAFALTQLLTPSTVDFDTGKWNYVGAPTASTYVLYQTKAASEKNGVTKFEDSQGPNGKQLVLGATSTGLDYDSEMLMKDVLGANIKIVGGYPGSTNIKLAMDQGELDGYTNSWDSVKATNLADVQNGNWMVLMSFTPADKVIPDLKVPSWQTFAKTDEDHQLLKYGMELPSQFARPYVVAPEVPADRVAALQAAWEKVMQDPDMATNATKAQLSLDWVNGPTLSKTVKDFLAMPDSIKTRLHQILVP